MKSDVKLDLRCAKIGFFIIRTLGERGLKSNRSLLEKGFRGFVTWEENPKKLRGYSQQDYKAELQQYSNEFIKAVEVLIDSQPAGAAVLSYYKIQLEHVRSSEGLWKVFEGVKEVLEQ